MNFYAQSEFLFRLPDYYHTCYGLSGLSIAQHFAEGKLFKPAIVGSAKNEVVHSRQISIYCCFYILIMCKISSKVLYVGLQQVHVNDNYKNKVTVS